MSEDILIHYMIGKFNIVIIATITIISWAFSGRMDGWLLVMVRTEGEGDACDNEEMTAHTSTSFVVEKRDIYQ